MNLKTIREKAAKCMFEADLTLTDETSVTKLIDLLEHFGKQIALEYYHKGTADMLAGKVSTDFCNPKDKLGV